MPKNDYVNKLEKVKEINLTIMSKQHAYSPTMKKTPAKFHKKEQYETVRSSTQKALTVYIDRKL